jgi:hypothetical protein
MASRVWLVGNVSLPVFACGEVWGLVSPVRPLEPYEQQPASAWMGGHGTEPYEQNTQQSPGSGFSRSPHLLQS